MLLSVGGLSKSFGIDVVLDTVTFRIDPREKVALVGRNGTGKTTLLRILCGEREPEAGGFNLARGARIGYLRQETPVGRGRTVLEEAETALARQLELKKRLEALEERLESGATPEDLDEYTLVHEHEYGYGVGIAIWIRGLKKIKKGLWNLVTTAPWGHPHSKAQEVAR